MKIRSHYTILAYPFFHTISGEERKTRLQKIQPQWRLWLDRIGRPLGQKPDESNIRNQNTSIERALDDTYFFLPYVRQLLFPETTLLPAGDAVEQVTAAERLIDTPLEDLVERLNVYGIIRLTYDPSSLAALNPLALSYQHKNNQGELVEEFSGAVRMNWVDIVLMPQNIGFLFLKLQLDEKDITTERLNDFLYYVRQVHKPTVGWQLPSWKHRSGNEEYEFSSRDLVDFLLQGVTESQSHLGPPVPSLTDWKDKLDTIQRYSLTERGQVYGQTFRLYTYACLDSTADATSSSTAPPPPASDPDTAHFASITEQTLYELATCTRTDDQDFLPHPVGLKQIMETGHIALWANWEAMALHDNVVFLASQATAFTQGALPHNVESDYFHLYLLALYQKIRLSILSGELMRRGDDLYENLHEARELWDAFTMFRNHFWFAEVTFKPQGTELYKRFQRGLNVLALYEGVNNEVRELQQYYERKADQELAEATRELQQSMAGNVEITRQLQEKTNEAVLAARDIADRQLALTGVMKENLEVTNTLQADTTKQLKTVANIQIKVEWIEIFVVGFYAAELTHIIVELFEKEYHLQLWWSTTLVLAMGLISGLIAWAMLRPSHHNGS